MTTPSAMTSPRFYALSESRELAVASYREAAVELAPLEERLFEGGEFKLRPLDSVRGRPAFVFQSLAGTTDTPTAQRFVRLLFLLGGLRDAGASSLTAVIPYLAYARKDRRTQLRDPVNTRYVAELLEAVGADRVIALDVHNAAAFDNAFRIPTDHLSALPMMADHYAARLGNASLVVVSPDVGGIKRAQLFQELMERQSGRSLELAFIEKRRARGAVSSSGLAGEVAERHALVIDDLCATGGTLIRAAEWCKRAGAAAVHVAVTHAPLAAGIDAVLAADCVTDMVITDSVASAIKPAPALAPKLTVLSVAPLFGAALSRIVSGQPLAPLLSRWPVPS